jgi:hypothetical protein
MQGNEALRRDLQRGGQRLPLEDESLRKQNRARKKTTIVS